MPWWAIIYTVFLAFLIGGNLVYWVRMNGSWLFFFYELLAGSYLVLTLVSYWTPSLSDCLGMLNIPPIVAIIGLDFYYTVYGNIADLGPEMPEMETSELETAKVFSIIIAAPAYLIGALTSYDIVEKFIGR